ncbi:ATP-binding protein [Streptomyces cinnabarinus]|uniref:ATP-binding protein n=1 Tax=Streptomyces cinnabarinus TaxID=67287 RepID=A0ABY7KJ89_9ACTN|nr:ATP-binding protein [Streptomyces cinnabarinus]WAZ23182.1 ATP-binding protein [Streptomyces cinnabarinus]
MDYEETRFWRLFSEQIGVQAQSEAQRLAEQFKSSRKRAALIAAEISRDSADLTQHDISHIDALWEYAELVCGPEYVLNPAEIYVLGIAFLAHDLANGLAAIPGGMEHVKKDARWLDILTSEYRAENGVYPSPEKLTEPDPEIKSRAISRYLRETHADFAANIPLEPYKDTATGESFYLLEDAELRNQYGHLAGRIAASHWWPSRALREEFSVRIGARASMPSSWEVDPLALAFILRCADASHLDSRRAPAFLRAVRSPRTESMPHWVFQDKLQKPRIHDDRLSYTSLSPFGRNESEAWWVCHDALSTLHHELTAADNILSDSGRDRFAARGVVGISDLEELSRNIRTDGWHPINATVKATDVITLVRRLGGAELYGNDPSIPIRELISNAADAVRAKKSLLGASGARPWEITGDVTVSLNDDTDGTWLHIHDTGLGMSKNVLTNALLNFGTSYWDSPDSRRDLPGLLSSDFRPTGRYGIGFFSVFMIGRSVRVTSRRYDAAASETMVLEFANGLTGRPLLRNAEFHEQLVTGGTEVRVLLNTDLSDILTFDDHRGVLESHTLTLAEYYAWLCPALDVNLYVVNENGERVLAVEADDWKRLDRDSLIDRLHADHRPSEREQFKQVINGDPEPVYSPLGEMVAKIAIAPMISDAELRERPDSDDLHGVDWISMAAPLVVGGVRAKSSMQNCAGLIVGRTLRAARDVAIPVIPAQDFSAWATSQAESWNPTWDHYMQNITLHLVSLYAEPGKMPIGETSDGPVTYEQLVEHCKNLSRVILLQDAAWSNYCRRDGASQHELQNDVVLMHPGYASVLSFERSPHGGQHIDAHDWVGHFSVGENSVAPNSIPGIVIRAVAQAWSIDESELQSAYARRERGDARQIEVVGVSKKGETVKSVRLSTVAVLSRE